MMLLPVSLRPFPRQESRLNGRLQFPCLLFRFTQLPLARLNPLPEAFYIILQFGLIFSHNPVTAVSERYSSDNFLNLERLLQCI